MGKSVCASRRTSIDSFVYICLLTACLHKICVWPVITDVANRKLTRRRSASCQSFIHTRCGRRPQTTLLCWTYSTHHTHSSATAEWYIRVCGLINYTLIITALRSRLYQTDHLHERLQQEVETYYNVQCRPTHIFQSVNTNYFICCKLALHDLMVAKKRTEHFN